MENSKEKKAGSRVITVEEMRRYVAAVAGDHDHETAGQGGALDAAAIATGIFAEALVPFEAPGPIGSGTHGTGKFTDLEVTGVILGSAALLHVRDEKSQNTAGGTFTAGAQRTRDITTVKTNEIVGASLSSNQITLPVGTYWVDGSAPAFYTTTHQAKLYDTTGSADLILGTVEAEGTGESWGKQTRSFVQGRFTLGVESVIELQHRGTVTKATNGFGIQSNFTTEIYSVVMIWKVG